MYSKSNKRKESQIAIVGGDRNEYYYDYEIGESANSSAACSKENIRISSPLSNPNREINPNRKTSHVRSNDHRSSTISSSSDGSDKQLVKSSNVYQPSRRRLEKYYNTPNDYNLYHRDHYYGCRKNSTKWDPFNPYRFRYGCDIERKFDYDYDNVRKWSDASTVTELRRPRSLPKFFIENTDSHPPSRDSPSSQLNRSPPMNIWNDSRYPFQHIPSNRTPNYDHQCRLTPPDPNTRMKFMYDSFWHTPKASMWCIHEKCGDVKCFECQGKEDVSSTCSSVNPPPTFTAMDNYSPVKIKRRKCSCGAVSAATTALSTFVLLLIGAFIIYTEMVLKKRNYVPKPM